MTSVLEAPAYGRLPEVDALDQLPPDAQYDRLRHIRCNPNDPVQSEQYMRAMFDLGARPESSSSTLVRAYAIECGMERLMRMVRRGDPLPPDLAQLHDMFRALTPAYFDLQATSAVRQSHGTSFSHPYNGAYNWIWLSLAGREGIDKQSLLETTNPNLDHETTVNDVPVLMGMMMDRNVDGAGELAPGAAQCIAPELHQDALGFALEQFACVYQGRDIAEARNGHLESFQRVARFINRTAEAKNYEHDAPIEYLYNQPEGAAYAEALNDLYDLAPKLHDVFPIGRELIAAGTRDKVANALFALQYFVAHGNRIDTRMLSPSGRVTDYQEDDPLFVLQKSVEAIDLTHSEVTGGHTLPVFEDGRGQFDMCRFEPLAEGAPPAQVSYLGRAKRGRKYNPVYEFSPDQTLRYRAQLEGARPIEFANALQTPSTVSIRLDYDRFGFALDLGAASKNPFNRVDPRADIEVRIGRLFAFGNFLRSLATGVTPTQHHIRSIGEAGITRAEFGGIVTQHTRQLRAKSAGALAGLAVA